MKRLEHIIYAAVFAAIFGPGVEYVKAWQSASLERRLAMQFSILHALEYSGACFFLIMLGFGLSWHSRRKDRKSRREDIERVILAYCKARSHWWKFKLNLSRKCVIANLYEGKTPEEWEGIDQDFNALADSLSLDGLKAPKELSDNQGNKDAPRLSQDGT
jgi:hypothetical protein